MNRNLASKWNAECTKGVNVREVQETICDDKKFLKISQAHHDEQKSCIHQQLPRGMPGHDRHRQHRQIRHLQAIALPEQLLHRQVLLEGMDELSLKVEEGCHRLADCEG